MARRHDRGAKDETKLARARLASGLTQRDLSEATGISRSAYWRLERGRVDNPPLRHLTNCALVLGVAVEALIEDEWRTTWLQLSPEGPKAQPDPKELVQRSKRRAGWPSSRR
ncbi:MAG: Helix-turn-helix domain [Gaiellaceae bacterium]|nr:Helix-turn-helix domain [Gaiellaceae bacterium]